MASFRVRRKEKISNGSSTMKNINIYIHTWKINNWREILNEQLILIDESGLGDTASIHI